MIAPHRIRELLNRKPSRPIRISLSDGSKHDIPHPEFGWVFGGRLFIGVPGRGCADAKGQIKEIAILRVTRVEELGARGARPSK